MGWLKYLLDGPHLAFCSGGTAYLSLENEDTPYLHGIKYTAMPPTKRFRDMEQLSGLRIEIGQDGPSAYFLFLSHCEHIKSLKFGLLPLTRWGEDVGIPGAAVCDPQLPAIPILRA